MAVHSESGLRRVRLQGAVLKKPTGLAVLMTYAAAAIYQGGGVVIVGASAVAACGKL